jgi:hypothetical protein
MRRRQILFLTFIIVLFLLEYFASSNYLTSITMDSEKQDAVSLPNKEFSNIVFINDSLSDSSGNRAFPWGVETWTVPSGLPHGFPVSFFRPGQVELIGHQNSDIVVLAIPDPLNKPLVQPEQSYTQSFEVKLDNVQGQGVRLIFQTLNSSGTAHKKLQTNYGTFENGTSDWHTISFTAETVNGSAVGDIMLELWGSGSVYVRNPEFHATTIIDVLSGITIGSLLAGFFVWFISGFVLLVVVAGVVLALSFGIGLFRKPKRD